MGGGGGDSGLDIIYVVKERDEMKSRIFSFPPLTLVLWTHDGRSLGSPLAITKSSQRSPDVGEPLILLEITVLYITFYVRIIKPFISA